MRITKISKETFVRELLKKINGKFLTAREVGNNYQEEFFTPRSCHLVEPAKYLDIVLRGLVNKGLILKWGEKSTARYGLKRTVTSQTTLQNAFIHYFIKRVAQPLQDEINDHERPIIDGID